MPHGLQDVDMSNVFVDAHGELRSTHAQSPSATIRTEREAQLTPRRQEILELIAAGRSTADVAH